jgi:RNA polymerase sigma factor (sigma-70 family)
MLEDRYAYINNLITKIKSGDSESLFELKEFYKPLILTSIRRCLSKDQRLAPYKEDIYSESIFVLEKLVHQYDPNLTYFSYFLSTRIDINIIRYSVDKFLDKAESCEDYDFENTSDPLSRIEDVITLHEAINKLVPNQKQAIRLYFFEQKDQEEASKILNISQSAFSKRLQRAISSLKDILGDDIF